MTADGKVPVLIKQPGTAHTPRAHIVNQRTVEIFRHLFEHEFLSFAQDADGVTAR
jgi:hypothetical protein